MKQELKDTDQRWVWDTAFSNDSEHLLTGIILPKKYIYLNVLIYSILS